MSKDPAFLFYPGDWLGGTLGMTFEEKGAYMELLILQHSKDFFNEKQAITLIGNKNWDNIKEKFILDKNNNYFNQRLREEKTKRSNYVESRRQSRIKCDEDNVRIYIVRDNVRGTYKIGSSVNPIRRYNELSNQQNPAIMEDKVGERDITLIWYSLPVMRSEEKELHEEFNNKRITGEWYDLDKEDLNYIYEKYSGAFYERTLNRTENEDEDIKKKEEYEEKKEFNSDGYNTPNMFNKFWVVYPKKDGKGKALTKWNSICTKGNKRPKWIEIKKAILLQIKTERWQDPQFIPLPATWLNQSRWIDDPKEMISFNREEDKDITCPYKFKFGIDHAKYAGCDTCEDEFHKIWAQCKRAYSNQ